MRAQKKLGMRNWKFRYPARPDGRSPPPQRWTKNRRILHPPLLACSEKFLIPNFYFLIRQSTTPRSLHRRTGGLLLDRSFQYALPLAFLECRSDAGVIGELRGLPIHKTSLHADVCSGCYQNLILVWLIIVRYVSSLGQSGVSLFEEFLGFRTVQGFLGISELTSPWDSLLSCDYNVQ